MLRLILLISAFAITPVFAADLAPKKPATTEKSMDKSTTEEKTTIDEKTKVDDCDPTKEICPKKKDGK